MVGGLGGMILLRRLGGAILLFADRKDLHLGKSKWFGLRFYEAT